MKKQKILCAALIIALTLSAAGCSQSSDSAAVYGDSPMNGITAAEGEFKSTTAADDVDVGVTEADAAFDEVFDGEYAAESAADMAEVNGTPKAATDDKAEKTESKAELPEAGQLTAGEWSDNDNWGFFSNLVNSGTSEFPSFGINPTNRTAVTVKNKEGSAIVNAQARLLDKSGNVLWEADTNKQGVAYLFNQGDSEAVSVEIESGGKKQSYELSASKSNEQSAKKTDNQELEVTFDGKDNLYKNTDIMFIVDTTGSMGDEMLFLQSEFTAIAKEIGTKNTRYSVNFYRDEGDDYVTKCSNFTSDVDELQKKLNSESAEGGGDYPEAVAEILKETIFDGGWNDDSVKLAFLIFDAPPHEGTEKTLIAAAEEAAKKGIRIIPVVSSDSDRDTELFARSLAITTGGDYVFLTDDSGIGGSHMEPIIGSYEVRKLYNVIIDIINDYKQ